jgi:glycosyltransferase involved in cell wall biosynthesis
MQDILFVRSAPLNVTPAVERYARFLRRTGRGKPLLGLELDYGQPRPPVDFVDELHSLRRPFKGMAQRAVAMLAWQAFQVRTLVRLRPDVIQFCDVFSVGPALLAKLLWRAKVIYDIRDVAKLAVSHRGWLTAQTLGLVEAIGTMASDAVIVVDRPLVEALPRRVRAECFVVPNTPPQDLFTEATFSENDRLCVNLAGFISHRRNLEAWCAVAARRTDVVLDLYGTIADDQTRDVLARHGLADVKRLKHADALERTRGCDAVALMYDPSIGINRYAAPNKYYEALMFAKPIVCAEGMGLAAEVREWDCGFVLPYGDEGALERALERLKELSERRRLGDNARRLFVDRYKGRGEMEMRRLYAKVGIAIAPT